jgi:hypothetical protein
MGMITTYGSHQAFPISRTSRQIVTAKRNFLDETRCQGHLASGNLEAIISNPIILDRFKRGPMFRETTNDDLHLARQALKSSLRDLFERKKHIHAERWIDKFKKAFDTHAHNLKTKGQKGEIDLQRLLFPAPGKLKDHQKELNHFLEKNVILPGKCRGNYFVVCKNLYIRQCITALHLAPEYSKLDISKEDLIDRLMQAEDISDIIHH